MRGNSPKTGVSGDRGPSKPDPGNGGPSGPHYI